MNDIVVAANPVIRGFSPDPSIVQVGEWYYLATSTFEFFPGIRLHRSRDLVHWQVIGHVLDESNGFDLRGHPDSGGVWAPSVTHSEGRFWVAYSVVRSTEDSDNRDLDNYLVTAPRAEGPWSEPIPLGSRGFDFSFFHDDDGSHWIVGVQWDQRPGVQSFSGIVIEQYFSDTQRTSGDAKVIYTQTSLVEGPNLYRIDGRYHLLLAEGGTGWNHGVTTARSDAITGPYERDERPAVLTRRDIVGHELQKAGHGELIRLPDGSWALVHLASRPVIHGGARFSTLGRETCVQRVRFVDGWLRLASGSHHGEVSVPLPLASSPLEQLPARDDFDAVVLDRRRWATLRAPLADGVADLTSRPGWLRLRGGHSTASVFDQSMIVQRVTEHVGSIETTVDADPLTVRQSAGLCAWYGRHAWIWLQVCWDAEHGRHLRVLERDTSVTTVSHPIDIPAGPVRLRLDLDGGAAHFAHAVPGGRWTRIPGEFAAWKLSDDHGPRLRFTGMMVGIRVEDLDGTGWHADFDDVDARFRESDERARASASVAR